MGLKGNFVILLISVILLQLLSAEDSNITSVQKADSLYTRGKALSSDYEYEKAIDLYIEALDIHRALNLLRQQMQDMQALGEVYYYTCDYAKAMAFYDSALMIAREIQDNESEGALFHMMGTAYERQCDYEKSSIYCDSAITIAVALADQALTGKILATIGLVYHNIGKYDSAFVNYESALKIVRESNDKKSEAYILCCTGLSYDATSQYYTALAYYDSSLSLCRDIGNRYIEGTNYHNIGRTYYALGKSDTALLNYSKALPVRQQIGDRWGEGRTLMNIGQVYYSLGFYDSVLIYSDLALKIAHSIHDFRGMGITLNMMGVTYHHLSNIDKAISCYDSSLVLMEMIGSYYTIGATLNNIGMLYRALGNYEHALTHYDSALAISEMIGNKHGMALNLTNIAILYGDVGRYEEALVFFDSALVIERSIKTRRSEGITLHNIGSVYCDIGQYARAMAYYDSALVIQREVQDLRGEALNLDNYGAVYMKLGEYEQSLGFFDSSLVLKHYLGDLYSEGITRGNIGRSYYAMEMYDSALFYYEYALAIMKNQHDRYGEGVILDCIGQLYQAQGKIEDAIDMYAQSINVKESMRKELKRELLRAAYIEMERDVYERIINLLILLERYEEAFDYMERSRSEKLKRTLEESGVTALDPSLRRILDRINTLKTEITDVTKKFQKKELGEKEFTTKISELEGSLNQKFVDLKHYHPHLYKIMVPQVMPFKEIQKVIPKNSICMEYISVGDFYAVFLFGQKQFHVKLLATPKSSIDSMVTAALTDLKWFQDKEIIDNHFQNLYALLIQPVEEHVEKYDNIIIIPYGILHYMPFHALRTQERYFFEWKGVSYLPSARFFDNILPHKHCKHDNLLAFANCDGTLPNADIEVDSISRIMPGTKVYSSATATKEVFLDICKGYQYLHLATHAILDPDPRFSYIVMSPGGSGNLTVREIMGLSGHFENSSLITLSACETAIEYDSDRAGMELITLANAFQVAGVSSTIATLWEIADRATAILMREYYENLEFTQMDKLESLHDAQSSVLAIEQYSHPYYWAPFVFIGDWR